MHFLSNFLDILLIIFAICAIVALLVFIADCVFGLVYQIKERKQWKR